jgi:hypothetical protein
MYWPADETAGTQLKKGETLKLRYRVLVHSGDTDAAGIEAKFREYQKSN